MRTTTRTIRICAAALFALGLATVATAQQDMGNIATSGATYTTGVLTARGADSITVARDDGEVVTMLVDVGTVGADAATLDQRVRVDYHVNEQGQAVADVVQAGGPPATTVVTTASAPPPQPLAAEEPAPEPQLEPQPAIERELETRAEAAPETLPATASGLPLLLLLGATALAGAAVVRLAR